MLSDSKQTIYLNKTNVLEVIINRINLCSIFDISWIVEHFYQHRLLKQYFWGEMIGFLIFNWFLKSLSCSILLSMYIVPQYGFWTNRVESSFCSPFPDVLPNTFNVIYFHQKRFFEQFKGHSFLLINRKSVNNMLHIIYCLYLEKYI